MKHWKKIISAVFVLAVGLVVAGIAIIKSLDFNEYRGLVADQVKAATGRDLIIAGQLDLELSLNPALAVEGVSFANAPWGTRADMMMLKRLAAEVELLPLLTGDIRVKRLVLVGLDLLVETDAKGRGNWELAGSGKKAAKAEKIETSKGPSAPLPVVHLVRIKDAAVAYRDGRSGRTTVLRLDGLNVRTDGLDTPLTVELSGDFNGTAFQASGRLGPLQTLIEGGAPYRVSLNATALGAEVGIEGAIAEPRKGRGLDIRVQARGNELTETLAAVKGQVPALKDWKLPALGPFRAAAMVKGGPEALSLSGIDVSLGKPEQLHVVVKGSVADALAPRGLDLKLSLEGKDAAPLAKAAGVDLPKVPAFKVTAAVSDPNGGYLLDGLDARIGNSDLKGRVSVKLDGVARPTVDARLNSSLIDLDALLPKRTAVTQTPAVPKAGRKKVFPADPLPTEGLKVADARLRFKAKRLIAGGIAVEDIDLGLVLGAGRLDVKLLKAVLGGGKVNGDLVLDGSRPVPALSVNLDVRQVDYGAVLKRLQMVDIATGKVDAKVNLKGLGGSVRAIMAGLNGRARVVTEGGKVESGLINVLSADILAALPFIDSKGDKDIRCGVVDFDIRKGRAAAKALIFETGGLSMIGTGGINLADETIDLRIDPRAKKVSLLKLAMVPVNVGGTLAEPSVLPDVGGAAVDAVTGAVRTAKDIATGGVSTLGGLIGLGGKKEAGGSSSNVDDTDYCKLALARRPLVRARPKSQPGAAKTEPAALAPPPPSQEKRPESGSAAEKLDKKLDELGKGLGGALKGLFGQ